MSYEKARRPCQEKSAGNNADRMQSENSSGRTRLMSSFVAWTCCDKGVSDNAKHLGVGFQEGAILCCQLSRY